LEIENLPLFLTNLAVKISSQHLTLQSIFIQSKQRVVTVLPSFVAFWCWMGFRQRLQDEHDIEHSKTITNTTKTGSQDYLLTERHFETVCEILIFNWSPRLNFGDSVTTLWFFVRVGPCAWSILRVTIFSTTNITGTLPFSIGFSILFHWFWVKLVWLGYLDSQKSQHYFFLLPISTYLRTISMYKP